MTIVVGSISAPWGPIRVAAGARGLVAMEQLADDEAFAAALDARFRRATILPASAVDRGDPALAQLDAALRALSAFIAGDLDALDELALDLADRPQFDREVLAAVRGIPPGSTASYGEVARMVGRPGAARAVGGAVGRNPVGLAVPCHRVIAGDGTLGGYGSGAWGGRAAGLELKQALLAREGVAVLPRPGSA